MSFQLSTLSDYLDYYSSEQEINQDLFHQISLQTDETSEFPEFEKKLYFNINIQNSQKSQNSQETIQKSKGMFEVAKEDFGKRHTHKKDDKDNKSNKNKNDEKEDDGEEVEEIEEEIEVVEQDEDGEQEEQEEGE